MSKQSAGGHQVFSESECSAEYKASLACTSRYSYPCHNNRIDSHQPPVLGEE